MSRIRPTGGAAEVAVRSALHRRGFRFRKNVNSVLGRPDVVFSVEKVAVFIDGDFWHARVLRERGMKYYRATLRTSNATYWLNKAVKRIEIDNKVTKILGESGWHVMRFWESSAMADLDSTVATIAGAVQVRRVPSRLVGRR
jgi:DNA mismatch endonuclease (patch repair protein)